MGKVPTAKKVRKNITISMLAEEEPIYHEKAKSVREKFGVNVVDVILKVRLELLDNEDFLRYIGLIK